MRVLLAEDDAKLTGALQRGLQREGYAVDVAVTGEDALLQANVYDYDAVVLDVMLPGIDGFAVCDGMRRGQRMMPVMMLTARDGVRDRIKGLDVGADDYLIKPFHFGELLARLRALIRRGSAERPPVLQVGDLQIDPAAHTVTRDGQRVELTAREFAVLEYLAANAGKVVSRTALLEHVWDQNYYGSTNVVDVYVGYLRRKLEEPFGPRLIRTLRGVGFMLEAD
jgi:two-component system OmpR family response regulator